MSEYELIWRKAQLTQSMSNVTRRDLVVEISNREGLKQAQVEQLIEDFIELVSTRLSEGRHISLRGFGSFELRVAKSKIGRNPKRPGSEVRIPDRCVVRFKPGRELKQRVSRVPVEAVAGRAPDSAAG